jgi:hypothetical protein
VHQEANGLQAIGATAVEDWLCFLRKSKKQEGLAQQYFVSPSKILCKPTSTIAPSSKRVITDIVANSAGKDTPIPDFQTQKTTPGHTT